MMNGYEGGWRMEGGNEGEYDQDTLQACMTPSKNK